MIRTLLRQSGGFALVELLVVMSISTVILGGSLMTFETLVRDQRKNENRFDTAEQARNAIDHQARQLRNLARRPNNTVVIDTIGDYDFIFQTSDPNRTWVRYCLDLTGGAKRGDRLWMSERKVPATATQAVTGGMRADCPGTDWTQQTVVAQDVVNRLPQLDRPLFAFRCLDGTSACASSTATSDQIVNVDTRLFVDTTPLAAQAELQVSTSVFLRNQNQMPTASFTATRTGVRTYLLNASASSDPEGRTLSYHWFKGTMPTNINCQNQTQTIDSSGNKLQWGGNWVGRGVTLSMTFPASDGNSQQLGLVVCDPGDRFGTSYPPALSPIS